MAFVQKRTGLIPFLPLHLLIFLLKKAAEHKELPPVGLFQAQKADFPGISLQPGKVPLLWGRFL
jgi:hypothetical protein